MLIEPSKLKTLLCGIYITLMFTCFAQNSQIDSLENKLLESDLKDQDRVDLMNTISFQYHLADPFHGIKYGQEVLDLAQDMNYQLGIGNAYNSIGVNYFSIGEMDSAFNYFNRAVVVFDEIKNYEKVVKTRHNIAVILKNKKEYAKELKLYDDVEQYMSLHGVDDERTIANAWNNKGTLLKRMGHWHLAIEQYLKSLEYAKNNGHVVGETDALMNIARVYKDLRQTAQAKKFSMEALKVSHDAGYVLHEAQVLTLLGGIFISENSLDSAEQYLQEALEMRREQKNEPFIMFILGEIGKVNRMRGQYEEALGYHMEALKKFTDSNKKDDLAFAQVYVGHVHLLMGNIEIAEKHLMAGHRLGDSLKMINLLELSHELLAKVYEEKEDFETALMYQKAHYALKDTLYSVENVKLLGQQEAKYEYRQEKQQLIFDQNSERLRLEQEKEIIRTQLIAVAGGLLLLVISIGFIVNAYRDKARANQKLHQLDQFKTRLFANINHDLRTPLTLIQGYIHRITSNEDDYLSESTKEDLDNISSNAQTLSEMTNEIHDLILLEEGNLELKYHEVEMNSLLKRQVLMFGSMAEMVDIDLKYESEVPEQIVHLDKPHFEKILYNLLSNAFKFTPEGGQIKVVMSVAHSQAQITVSDTGKGINEKDLPNIFDRFYQSPLNEFRSKEGFGIGLAVVKELVELHGGTIEVKSTLDTGTTFIMNLPFDLDKETVAIEEETTAESVKSLPTKKAKVHMVPSQTENPTVLVVDDHEEIRQYIIDLISADYKIVEAANGKQALEVLEVVKVDLILTDLMMPWLDGFDLIEKLNEKEALSDIPVMVVSARTTEEGKHRVLDAGVNEFISKPFDPAMLQKRIKNLITDKSKANNTWETIVSDKNLQSNLEGNIVKKLNQVILNRISDSSLTIDIIADELSASRSKTVRLVKELTSQTPLEYIKTIRMDFVQQAIKTEKVKNASEAASSIGMSNATQFSNQYRKHFGKDPFA